jgi:hypothetical protein
MKSIEIEISYLEDMLLNEMIILVKKYSRNELYGQLKYIWDCTNSMLSYPNDSNYKINAAKNLLKININKPIKMNYDNDMYHNIRINLWYLYNALKKITPP